MEARRKIRLGIAGLAAAWMLAAQAAWALDGSEKVPTLPVTGMDAPVSALR
jgi:hypothetical protein